MDEAIIIGILCLLLVVVAACLFRNRGRRQTPRCSFSQQESGQDGISENYRMDFFSQECFPIIRAIQNKIQLIYQRCRWKSYSTVRVSTVSTQTDPCGQSEQMSVQRPLATNLSDSLTPQGPQSSHSTLIASYREATGQTPNPEAGRPAETGAEAGTKAITEVEDETDPPSCDAIARGTAQVVTEVTDPARPDLTTGAVQEAETEVTHPARPDLTTGAVQEAETEEVTDPARPDLTTGAVEQAETEVTDPARPDLTTGAVEEAETEVTDPARPDLTTGAVEEAETEVTDPARPDLTTGAVQEAETEVTHPARPDLTTGAVQVAETEEVTDPARPDLTTGAVQEAETEEVIDPARPDLTTGSVQEAVEEVVTDPARPDLTTTAVQVAVKGLSSPEGVKVETTKAVTEALKMADPERSDVTTGAKTAEALTMAVTDQEISDVITGASYDDITRRTTQAVPDATNYDFQMTGTETVAGTRTDSALQVPSLPFDFRHGQIPNDIDIHQNNKEAEDLGDDLQGSMFPVGNKEAEFLVKGQAEILVKEKALKAGSKTSCGDTAGNEMSLNKKGSLNSLCDNETSSSSSSNSEPTEQEESSNGYMGITDQSEIQLSKSQKTSKFEMGSLQRGQNQKIHEDKILRKKTDQGTQRMLFKGYTSKTYKLSQSIPPPKWETIDSEKTLSALSKPKQTNKWNVVSHLIGVVPDNHPLDAENEVKLMQPSYAKQRRCSSVCGGKDPAAGSKHTLSDSVSEYDADNEDSDPETAQPSYTKQKRSSSAQGEVPADVNAKCSGSDSLKKRGTVPDTTLDIIEEAPQTATMAATGVEPSQTVSCHKIQTELTLGHFSNSEPWKSDRKAGSEIESDITSVETDRAMADGSQNDDNGNLQVCGPEYTGDKERIQDEDGRNGGTSNPKDLGSIQDDNQKTNGSDDSKGNNSYSPPE